MKYELTIFSTVIDNILAKIIFYNPNIAAYNLQNRNILRVYKDCYARLLWRRYFDANGRGNVRRRDVSVRCEPPSVQRRFAVTECVPNIRSISLDNNALLFEIVSLQPISVNIAIWQWSNNHCHLSTRRWSIHYIETSLEWCNWR